MRALILAAGLGTRLRSITGDLPKPLATVADRPLIHYTLLLLKRYAITEVIVNLHYQGEKIRRELGNGKRFGMKIAYSEEPQILGTGGGIAKVRPFFQEQPFLVVNSDVLVDMNLDKLVDYHHRKKSVATLVLREDPEVDRYGAVEMDGEGRIRQFLGRIPGAPNDLLKRMFTGIHVIDPRVFDYIPPAVFSPITDAYIAMLLKDERLFGFTIRSFWADLGTPERYRAISDGLSENRIKLSYLKS
jgi:NDP-sugar pyrophosphorylase family protein